MEDFYDKIRDKMNDAPDVPTDWEMWDDIESSLDKKKRNRMLPVLLGLPFLLLFSGMVGYFLAPKSESLSVENVNMIRDTIYLTETIHTADTLVQTKYITQWKYQPSSDQLALQSKIQELSSYNAALSRNLEGLNIKLNGYRYAFSTSILRDDPKYRELDFLDPEVQIFSPTRKNDKNTDRSLVSELAYSPLLQFDLLEYDRPKLMLINNLLFENLVKNHKNESFLEQLFPDYINLGLSVEAPGLAFTKDLSPGLEAGFGLNVELLFSPRLSLVTGVRSRSTKNKTEDMQVASAYPQPVLGLEDEFKNLSVNSSFVDIPITFKYKVRKHNENDIYVTGGLLLSNQKQIEYKYEYLRNTSEVYYEEKIAGQGWSLGSSILGIGYEFDPWSNTSAFIESYARYNFDSQADAVHGMGFRFGIYYKI